MNPADRLLGRLRDVRPAGRSQWRARCPACDARTGLSIVEQPDGRLLLHDFGGCDAGAVLGAIGLALGDLYPWPLGEISGDRRAQPRHDPRDLLEAAAHEATTAVVLVSAVARERTASREQAERLAACAGRLLRFAELAR